MGVRRRLGSMTMGLALGVSVVVVAATALGAYLFSKHHYAHLLDATRSTARLQADLIRMALEHQMLENDRALIGEMVEGFGRDPSIDRVMILDRMGRPRFSSAPLPPSTQLTLDSPTCLVCHARPPGQRAHSAVIDTNDGTVLRSVLPIENREACHRCHSPGHRINGVLIVDVATDEMRSTLEGDIGWFVFGSAALALLLLAAIAVVVRLVVWRRLRRFEETARAIAGGDLSRRIPVAGNDTISWLAREFNDMADSATRLLGEIRQQQERLETVINSVDDGIVVLGRDRRVVAANDGFLRRIGRSREDVVGRPCRAAMASLCASAECPAERSFEGGERHTSIVGWPGPDGRMRHEEVRSSPIRGAGGETSLVVEVWRDITERRSAEARMAESHRMASLGMLASGFSHELNTPLATVLACVEGILGSVERAGPERDADRAEVMESAKVAREQLLRCRGITQHFLRLSRGQDMPSDIVDVGPIVSAVARLVEPTAREHGVTVAADPPPGPATVRAADAQLQQVLLNLLINAIQACGKGGTVRVAVEMDGGVTVRVSDDGRGIPPDAVERIFEPFFSLRQGGTGLGLFLSLNLVRGWGGEIRVTSEVGKGSTFEVVFPPLGGPPRESNSDG